MLSHANRRCCQCETLSKFDSTPCRTRLIPRLANRNFLVSGRFRYFKTIISTTSRMRSPPANCKIATTYDPIASLRNVLVRGMHWKPEQRIKYNWPLTKCLKAKEIACRIKRSRNRFPHTTMNRGNNRNLDENVRARSGRMQLPFGFEVQMLSLHVNRIAVINGEGESALGTVSADWDFVSSRRTMPLHNH